MIPKKIHYCWFGGKPLPILAQKFIKKWQETLPDYQIIRWDESNFDVNCNEWVKETYEQKKYSFTTDFCRFKVLYDHGGIYLDVDVDIHKNLDEFLDNDFIIGFMDDATLATAFIGARQYSSVVAEILEMYNQGKVEVDIPNNVCITEFFLENYEDFRVTGKNQILPGRVKVFNKNYFDRATRKKNLGYATHHYFGTWYGKNPNRTRIVENEIITVIAQYIALRTSKFYKLHKKHKKEFRLKQKLGNNI